MSADRFDNRLNLQSEPVTTSGAIPALDEIAAMRLLRAAYDRTQFEKNGITFEHACRTDGYAVALINMASEIFRGRR